MTDHKLDHMVTIQTNNNTETNNNTNMSSFQQSKHTQQQHTLNNTNYDIDVNNNRYPSCIVFGSLPLLTWLIPIIGHLGIADSSGKIHDFAGSYYVSIDDFMVGKVLRYYKLNDVDNNTLDNAIEKADSMYNKQTHNLVTNNCHHHVATALQQINNNNKYNNISMLQCWFLITVYGKYPSFTAFIYQWLPFCVILTLALCLGLLIK